MKEYKDQKFPKINNYLITTREGLTVKFQTEGWNFLYGPGEPLGEVHK